MMLLLHGRRQARTSIQMALVHADGATACRHVAVESRPRQERNALLPLRFRHWRRRKLFALLGGCRAWTFAPSLYRNQVPIAKRAIGMPYREALSMRFCALRCMGSNSAIAVTRDLQLL
jgi:hypothetical protein